MSNQLKTGHKLYQITHIFYCKAEELSMLIEIQGIIRCL